MFAKLLERYMASTPHVAEQGVCWGKVLITAIICGAVVVIACMVKNTILKWIEKTTKEPANNNTPKEKDNTVKYVEKLVDFLQAQTKVYGEKGEFKQYKPFDSPESKMYNDVLACLIGAQQQKDKGIDIDKLRKALKIEDHKENNSKSSSDEK